MDPRDRADALLNRAQARGAFVVTPDNATSPMDAANTQQIPRSVIDEQDPDTTAQVSAATIRANDHHLASSEPTSRLDARPNPGPRATRPMPVPGRPAPPPARGPQEPEQPVIEEQELGGLIPTTTQVHRSNLSRRLDGI